MCAGCSSAAATGTRSAAAGWKSSPNRLGRGTRPTGWGRSCSCSGRPHPVRAADVGIRVLLVEDDPGIADFIVRGLREEGFTVEHAADGTDGWHRLGTGTWDAVLLDW